MNSFSPVNFESSDGSSFAFKTYDQLKDWANNENEAWLNYQGAASKYTQSLADKSLRNYWNSIIESYRVPQFKAIADFLNNTIQNEAQNHQENLNALKRTGYIAASSTQGNKILSLSAERIDISLFLLSLWHPRLNAESLVSNRQGQLNDQQFKGLVHPLITSYIEAYFFDAGLKGTAKVEKAALQQVKNDANGYLATISETLQEYKGVLEQERKDQDSFKREFDSFIQEKNKIAKGMLKKHVDELADLKRIYKEELSLQIPVTYWKSKAKDHRIAAYMWGAFFSISIALIIFFSPNMLEKMIVSASSVLPNLSENPLSLLFLVTFPAFLIVWLLRMFARNIITNFTQMHDANNRSVMTQTFLALMSEGKANENDRILILNALFQPMNTQSDDGSPPHWFEIMTERMKK